MLRGLAIFYVVATVWGGASTAIMWALASRVHAHVTAVSFGFGVLVPFRRADPKITWGPIPGGWIELAGRNPVDGEPLDDDPRSWFRIGLAARLAVVATPVVGSALLAVVLLGPAHAGTSFVHGLYQLFVVVDLTPLVRRLIAIAAHASVVTVSGIVIAKLAAFNAVPLPGLPGGAVMYELRGRSSAGRVTLVLGTLAMLWVVARFVWAIIHVVVTS